MHCNLLFKVHFNWCWWRNTSKILDYCFCWHSPINVIGGYLIYRRNLYSLCFLFLAHILKQRVRIFYHIGARIYQWQFYRYWFLSQNKLWSIITRINKRMDCCTKLISYVFHANKKYRTRIIEGALFYEIWHTT